jgi:hypothetical protein
MSTTSESLKTWESRSALSAWVSKSTRSPQSSQSLYQTPTLALTYRNVRSEPFRVKVRP